MKAREGKFGPHSADTEKQLKPLAACRRLSEQPPKVSLEATLTHTATSSQKFEILFLH